MDLEIEIRMGTERDLPELFRLVQEFATFQRASDQLTNSLTQLQDEFEHVNFLVAESCDGSLVGYLAFFECYYTWSGRALHMDDLYVQPAHRGRGVGQRMVQKLKAVAQVRSCQKIKWAVSRWNKGAIDFYDTLGADISDDELECSWNIGDA